MNIKHERTYTKKVMCRTSTSGVNVWGFIEAPLDSALAGQTVPCLIDKYASEELARFDHPDIEGFADDFPDARADIITAARSIKFNHSPLFELVAAGVLIAGVLALLFVAGCSDAAYEERKQHELYCDMVSIWEADEAKGIRAEERSGWPPYKGECK